MENKKTYTPEEITKMVYTHLSIVGELGNLEAKAEELKQELYARGKKEDFDRAWGHILGNRYVAARESLKKIYEEAIPENVREIFKSANILSSLEEERK
jgi:hypothetical protein